MSALWVTLVSGLVQAAAIVAFPAIALRAWRTGGGRKLFLITAAALGIVAITALALASDRFGNRLSATYGYSYIATRVLITYMITLGLPMLAVASIVRATSRAGRSFAKHYLIAVIASLIVWAGAVVLSIYAMPALDRSGASEIQSDRAAALR